MNRSLIVLTALMLTGGTALADHSRGGGRYTAGNYRTGSFHYVDHGGYRSWTGGRWDRNYFRGYYYTGGYYRPWVGPHYYSYYHRPALIVESYGAMPGYYWVSGSWNWDGNEWLWYPGHFEPL